MTEITKINDGPPADELLAMLRGDQRLRWQQGQRVLVEAYLEHYPQLRDRPETIRELLLNEMRLRRELSDPFELNDLLRRFPQFTSWLAEQFARLKTPDSDTPSNMVNDDSPWPILPGYQVLEELGRGGMGIVYKAQQYRLNRVVALKMLLDERNASASVRTRFRREAEAVAQLQHPYIVQVFDVIEHDGQLYLALEYVGGGSLTRLIRGRPRPPMEAAELLRKLAQGMQCAHERGIIHRDLKPSNVLLTDDGIPKITDFGLAKRIDDDTSRTQTGTVLGTPDYMPPEQAEGRVRDIGPASDVYALGCILYETLTGQPPFRGEALVKVLDAVRFKKPRPPREVNANVPQSLDAICLKCLEKSPANRYANAGELAEDLNRFLRGEAPHAGKDSTWDRIRSWFKAKRT